MHTLQSIDHCCACCHHLASEILWQCYVLRRNTRQELRCVEPLTAPSG